MYPKFIITRTGALFNYLFLDAEGEVILSGNLYASVKACLKEIEQVRRSGGLHSCYAKIKVQNGQYSFVLHDKHGVAIGHGCSWWSHSTRDCMITLLRREVGQAAVEGKSMEPLKAEL